MNKTYFVILYRMYLWSWKHHWLMEVWSGSISSSSQWKNKDNGFVLVAYVVSRSTLHVPTLHVTFSRKVSTLWTLQLFCYSPKSGSQVLLQRTIYRIWLNMNLLDSIKSMFLVGRRMIENVEMPILVKRQKQAFKLTKTKCLNLPS